MNYCRIGVHSRDGGEGIFHVQWTLGSKLCQLCVEVDLAQGDCTCVK